MGKKIISKRVRIPQYSPSDHTPEFFSDPFAGRLIPTAYFLKELDVLGPQNWMNMLSAEFVLRVVRNSAIHGNADSNDQMECYEDYYDNAFSNGGSEDESDMEHDDDRANIDTHEHYSHQRRPQAYSQTHPLLCIPTTCSTSTMLPSPPASPMSSQTPSSPSPYSYFIPSPLPSPPLPSDDIFFCHTLILATQSGYFNRLLGPINSPTYTPYSKYASFLAFPAYSSDSQIFALPTINISVPHPSCFSPILHWLYNHDDDEWLDTMTLDNFGRVYENVVFLKLGREAYDVLDQFLEETEDAGIDYEIEGVLEEC